MSILSFLCKIDIMSTKQYFLVVIVVVISLLIAFYSGYFVKAKVNTSNLKPYFSDEIILITKEKPHLTLIAYSSRGSQDNKTYSHRQKAFFFGQACAWLVLWLAVDGAFAWRQCETGLCEGIWNCGT